MTHPENSFIDYLVVGHIAKDLMPQGYALGGSAAYAGRTAAALGLRVGVLTSIANDVDLSPLEGIKIVNKLAPQSTTFENRYTSTGRIQWLHSRAMPLLAEDVPDIWREAPIVHLAPIAAEVNPDLLQAFTGVLLGITPQGWMRRWDKHGRVEHAPWNDLSDHLTQAGAVVLSLEDLSGAQHQMHSLARTCTILAVTEGAQGARVFWRGEERHFPAPEVDEIDPTGAGDIFAAVFFTLLANKRTPWEAALPANILAARSVTRKGLESTPQIGEVQRALAQVTS